MGRERKPRPDDQPLAAEAAFPPAEEGLPERFKVSRRGFFTTVGVGGVVMATAGCRTPAPAASPADLPAEAPAPSADAVRVTLQVNGREHRLLVEPSETLLQVLRHRLGITGPKPGCERGECGACSVLLGDRPRYACLTLAVEAEGQPITTVEGLMQGEELGPVQQAFVEHDALQCGYCTPGQIIAVEGLLRREPAPTLDQVRVAVSGNLCRCGAYAHIFEAAQQAASVRGKGGR